MTNCILNVSIRRVNLFNYRFYYETFKRSFNYVDTLRLNAFKEAKKVLALQECKYDERI